MDEILLPLESMIRTVARLGAAGVTIGSMLIASAKKRVMIAIKFLKLIAEGDMEQLLGSFNGQVLFVYP